jgi:predicted anti-sigma-YlaC factor YlaD
MRCRDAKRWLTTQRDDLTQSETSMLREHLKECPDCRTVEQHLPQVESLLGTSVSRVHPSVSTAKIMQAVQEQKRIKQQWEALRVQQQLRIARWRTVGTALAALSFFILGSIPLLILAITIIQTDLVVKSLSLLSSVIDILIVFSQYLQVGLILVTRNNWLLSGVAFAVVVMMGMWLRLMRPPHEV